MRPARAERGRNRALPALGDAGERTRAAGGRPRDRGFDRPARVRAAGRAGRGRLLPRGCPRKGVRRGPLDSRTRYRLATPARARGARPASAGEQGSTMRPRRAGVGAPRSSGWQEGHLRADGPELLVPIRSQDSARPRVAALDRADCGRVSRPSRSRTVRALMPADSLEQALERAHRLDDALRLADDAIELPVRSWTTSDHVFARVARGGAASGTELRSVWVVLDVGRALRRFGAAHAAALAGTRPALGERSRARSGGGCAGASHRDGRDRERPGLARAWAERASACAKRGESWSPGSSSSWSVTRTCCETATGPSAMVATCCRCARTPIFACRESCSGRALPAERSTWSPPRSPRSATG